METCPVGLCFSSLVFNFKFNCFLKDKQDKSSFKPGSHFLERRMPSEFCFVLSKRLLYQINVSDYYYFFKPRMRSQQQKPSSSLLQRVRMITRQPWGTTTESCPKPPLRLSDVNFQLHVPRSIGTKSAITN